MAVYVFVVCSSQENRWTLRLLASKFYFLSAGVLQIHLRAERPKSRARLTTHWKKLNKIVSRHSVTNMLSPGWWLKPFKSPIKPSQRMSSYDHLVCQDEPVLVSEDLLPPLTLMEVLIHSHIQAATCCKQLKFLRNWLKFACYKYRLCGFLWDSQWWSYRAKTSVDTMALGRVSCTLFPLFKTSPLTMPTEVSCLGLI